MTHHVSLEATPGGGGATNRTRGAPTFFMHPVHPQLPTFPNSPRHNEEVLAVTTGRESWKDNTVATEGEPVQVTFTPLPMISPMDDDRIGAWSNAKLKHDMLRCKKHGIVGVVGHRVTLRAYCSLCHSEWLTRKFPVQVTEE